MALELPEYWYGSDLVEEDEFLNNVDAFWGKEIFIYVAYPFDSKEYKDVKAKLEAIGLNEFSNFLSSEAYGKKMVIINANCHATPYAQYLLASKKFSEKYYIYPLAPIQNRTPVDIPEIALRNCDVYIHQIISEHNPYSNKVSDEYVYSFLKEDCCKLAVPNFSGGIGEYGRFCFPQVKECRINHPTKNVKRGIFVKEDMVIDECLFRGLGINVILRCYRDEDLISGESIREKFNEFLKVFKKAEEKWDIKISDFFDKKNLKILTAPGHPGREVLAEIGKRILLALEIEECVQFNWEFGNEYPILACVSKALEMEERDFIRDNMRHVLSNHRMDLEEYVRQYIYWVHEYDLIVLFSHIRRITQNKNFILYNPTVYVRQLLNIMQESIIDTLDAYQHGMPVVIFLDLNAKIRVQSSINSGVRIDDIYVVETGDLRKAELTNLLYDYPKVILYGMGNDFKHLIDDGNDKIAVCDKIITENYLKDGIEYITMDTLVRMYKEAVVYVTSTVYGVEIQDELIKKGFPKEKIVLNKTSVGEIDMHLANAKVVPLIQSKVWKNQMP